MAQRGTPYPMPWLEQLGIPDEEMDAIINGAIDRAYTGEDIQPGDAQLFRMGGFDPSLGGHRPVAHSRSWARDKIDSGEMSPGRMEEQWREPDDQSLDAILSLIEGGGDPSANDEMLLDMMKVDGFGDGQGDLMERYDHARMKQFPEMDYGEQPIWGGDGDEWPPGWYPPSGGDMQALAAQIANSQRPQMGARGDTGGPMGAYPSIGGGGRGGPAGPSGREQFPMDGSGMDGGSSDLDAIIDLLVKEQMERGNMAAAGNSRASFNEEAYYPPETRRGRR